MSSNACSSQLFFFFNHQKLKTRTSNVRKIEFNPESNHNISLELNFKQKNSHLEIKMKTIIKKKKLCY